MRLCDLGECTAKNQFEADMDKKTFEKKLVSFRLPEDLLDALRSRADEENTTVTELLCRLVRQGLQTSPDDRLSALEEEVRELRQLKQVNFGNISPVPIYAPLLPQNVVTEPDTETKQRILRLEAQMEAGFAKLGALGAQMESIANLEAMMEKVLAVKERSSNQHPSSDEGSDEGVV
ncbi:MAG: hypothetical protein IGS48_24995 [Oscillatoriales cyanobacterium C42_A2020_001]|nr:hypothetical protein [Leptolyngbyaceae cyanobacterium C42_A2020_001]